jgi:drug/metabolite transporter (DMT)-like permease
MAATETAERVLSGIALTSAAYFFFSTHDAAIKLLVASVSVWQVMFFRAATILVGLLAIGGRDLMAEAARSPIIPQMFLRSFLILAAWLCFYTAAREMHLAELTTIYFAAPLIITIMSIPLLGERVPPVRWFAVLTGFVGVFIACNPVELGISIPILLVLAAAFLWSLSIVLLRRIASRERTMVQLVLNNIFFLAAAAIAMPFIWQVPDLVQFCLLVAAGVLGGLAQFCLFEGMRRAPVSVLAPFEYTSLLWAFALGYMIWGDVPRTEVSYGAALIMAAGLIIIVAERRRGLAG